MRIVFVRHGDPDYKNDCLTEQGHKQAEAAAERLKNEPFTRLFASSCGRAVETAEHIAENFNLEVEKLDFMREIAWGSADGEPIPNNGHPWNISDDFVRNGTSLIDPDWQDKYPYNHSLLVPAYQRVSATFDEWLTQFGLKREGLYYRAKSLCPETILLASHGGSSSVVFAHLFNLPLPWICKTICPDFTAITVVTFDGKDDELISPRFEITNDARHIKSINNIPKYDR